MSYMSAKDPNCETQTCPADLNMVIIPRAVDLGGVNVRRALPSTKKCMVGPFIFWDQAGPDELMSGTGIDVRPHPHIGLSTLTYLFEGRFEHRDSLGNHQIIMPGDINLMTAGQGIAHSERTPQADRVGHHKFFGIQCWLALPKNREEMQPDFAHYESQSMPVINEQGFKATVVAGTYQGLKSPVKTVSETLFIDCKLNKGTKISIPAEVEERAVYILTGQVVVDNITYPQGRMLLLKSGHDVDLIASDECHIILLGGSVLDGERHVWWNFVSSNKDRIEQAKSDWIEGRFAKIPGDDKEFIPLPE